MVQMYVWLVVAVLLAAGVLLLALVVTRASEPGRDADGAPRTLTQAAQQTWLDFRSGVTTLRSRVARGSGHAPAASSRAGAPARVSVLAGRATARGDERRPADAWSFETPQDTTIDDFFAATQTSEPAYMDTAQVTDLLHRRR